MSGRPTINGKRMNKVIAIRLLDDDHDHLIEMAERHKISKGEYLRRLLQGDRRLVAKFDAVI